MRHAVLCLCLFSSGCIGPKGLTNDDIIQETKKCEAAGMRTVQIINGWNYSVISIHCTAKEGK